MFLLSFSVFYSFCPTPLAVERVGQKKEVPGKETLGRKPWEGIGAFFKQKLPFLEQTGDNHSNIQKQQSESNDSIVSWLLLTAEQTCHSNDPKGWKAELGKLQKREMLPRKEITS